MTAPTLAADAVAREQLTGMARTWDARLRPYESLREWVNPALDPGRAGCACGHCLVSLWSAFMWDLSLLDGLNEEIWATPRDWRDVNPELTGPDRFGQALEEIEMRVAAGLDALTRGTR